MKEFFFNVISVDECKAILGGFPRLGAEEMDLVAALGHCLAKDIFATENLPEADRASMDGYAVRAADVFGASESNPAYLEQSASIEIGQIPDFTLAPGHCAAIVTGGYLPKSADAVVMVEHTKDMGAGTIEIRRSLAPHDNVMLRGEDASKGQLLLPHGAYLRPQEIGFLAAFGLTRPLVHTLPRVAIISTGDELIEAGQPMRTGHMLTGKIRDVNSPALGALVAGLGIKADLLGIVPDNKEALSAKVHEALLGTHGYGGHDVVLLSGGSSVGTRDYTVEVLSSLPGAQILVQGVAMSPGKPLIVGRIQGQSGVQTVIGLPGQITSAQVVMHVLILPFLRHLSGLDIPGFSSAYASDETTRGAGGETGGGAIGTEAERTTLNSAFLVAGGLSRPALLARNIASRQGREDYVRVRLEVGQGDSLPLAHPILGKSGLARTLVEAHGLLRIPADVEGFEAGSCHEIMLL